MDALRRARISEFEERAIVRIRQEYPDDYAALGQEGTLSLVRHTVRSGAARGIHTEQALGGLMQLYIEFGTGLELAPYRQWALELLDHPKLPGPIKVNLVRSRLFALTQGRRMVRHTEDEEA
jgi:hypothetical protein